MAFFNANMTLFEMSLT